MKRIYIQKKHFASIPDSLYNNFKQIETQPFLKWVRIQVYREYNLDLNSESDVNEFKEILKHEYYDNTSEWLKEKMRLHIRLNNKKKDIRFYVERITSRGQSLYMQHDKILSQYSMEPIYSWTNNINLCAKFNTYSSALKCFEKNFSSDIEYSIKEYENI